MNSTLSVGGIFCDIQQAFHFINHDILLPHFQFYSTVGSAITLITPYLKDRYQQVLINSTSPLWGKINNGELQSSTLNYYNYVCIKFMFYCTV